MQYFSLQSSPISNIIDNKSIYCGSILNDSCFGFWDSFVGCDLVRVMVFGFVWCGSDLMWSHGGCFIFGFVYGRQFDRSYNHKWQQRQPTIDKNYGGNLIMRDGKLWDYPNDFRASQMIFGQRGWWFLPKKMKMV